MASRARCTSPKGRIGCWRTNSSVFPGEESRSRARVRWRPGIWSAANRERGRRPDKYLEEPRRYLVKLGSWSHPDGRALLTRSAEALRLAERHPPAGTDGGQTVVRESGSR